LSAVDRPLEEAATIPGPFFSDPSVYALELERIFQPSWHCVAREDELPEPGDFLTTDLAGSGIVLVRGRDAMLRAFHNVCRHRGTRIVEQESGSGLKRLLCPYHAWTYELDGRLVGAPHMQEVREFDKAEFGLLPLRLETWRGFVFVTLNESPPPLVEFLGELVPRARPFPLENLRRAHRVVYEIAANWKLVVQNANECYHCPGVHPQLVKITPYRSGVEDLVRGPVFGGWMDFVEGAQSLTMDGRSGRPPFPNLPPEDYRRVYYYVLYPNNFLSLLPDYVTMDRFIPLGPERTRLIFDLYLAEGERGGSDDAMEFWELTNRQDWHICEMAHLGSRTAGYRQGRYSTEEEAVHLVDRFYLRQMGLLPPPHAGRRTHAPATRVRSRGRKPSR
jgi:Rieske 2Fe-2S family protein